MKDAADYAVPAYAASALSRIIPDLCMQDLQESSLGTPCASLCLMSSNTVSGNASHTGASSALGEHSQF